MEKIKSKNRVRQVIAADKADFHWTYQGNMVHGL